MYPVITVNAEDVETFEDVEITLSYTAYDPVTYAPATMYVKDAEISVNGRNTGIKTDENGKATIVLTKSGANIITASVPQGVAITPPVHVESAKFNFGNMISYYFNYIINLIKGLFVK